jgi:hypothetical protein
MRAAVMLRYYHDMSEPEVAAALGVSVGTVKSTVARAVAKLREDAELGADTELDPGESPLGSPPDLPLLEGYAATILVALSPSKGLPREISRADFRRR